MNFFNSLIHLLLARQKQWKAALQLMDECYRQPGIEPDVVTYTLAIKACAMGGKTNRALSLFQVVLDKADKQQNDDSNENDHDDDG